MSTQLRPQASATTLASRLAKQQNSLFRSAATSRAAKRNAASKINYSEDYYQQDIGEEDNDDDYEHDGNVAMDIFKGVINNNHFNQSGAKLAPQITNPDLISLLESSPSGKDELIVPVKLNVHHNGLIIRDSLLWNLNDSLTPETFAAVMVEDLELTKAVESTIVQQIQDQIDQYTEIFQHPNNSLIDQFLINEGEFHVVLELSVYIGEDFFTDRVEWNLLDKSFTPEMFAKEVVRDMCLRREFETAIAFAIYEEIYKIKREIVESPQQIQQYIDSLPFFNLVHQPSRVDDASKLCFQGVRYDKKKLGEEFGPFLEKLSEWEIEKRETEKERNLRRRKRETMRVR